MEEPIQPAPKEKMDWKLPFFCAFMLLAGTFIGEKIATEKIADGIAKERCGVIEKNVQEMIHNFNVLAINCPSFSNMGAPRLVNNTTRDDVYA